MSKSKFCLIVLISLAQAGCSAWLERRAVQSTVGLIGRTRAAMAQESDIEMVREATPGGIKTLEGFYLVDPGNRALVALLAESYCQFAAGFLQDDWEAALFAGDAAQAEAVRARARVHLARCVSYGVRLLGRDWQATIYAQPDGLVALAQAAKRRHVAGMFWVALGLGTMIGMDPMDPGVNTYLPAVLAMLERVIALDEAHQNGLALMTLAIILSSQSAAVGGDPDRGKALFERARALAGGKALMLDVMMARTHAVTTRDRAAFHALLGRVLQTPASIWPEQRLANELAQRKARRYLAHEARFF
ncbi:MAG TPA: TRAP transporter TatT component family protein [Haliangium sp.]|nr:TRAP transporter TatT component family protein [Haliangium sp.]